MRLDTKIFLTSALVIVVLAGVAVLSLRALGRVVSANREIATRTAPALGLIASAREAIPRLVRLEGRAVVLGDQRYVSAWKERAAAVAEELKRLGGYADTEEEARPLREAGAAFERYRRIVAEELALARRGERELALRLSDRDARARADQVEASLDRLMAAAQTRLLATQAEAARLEARTWTAVLGALGASVGLALLATGLVARQMTRSLRQLSAATARVASGAFGEPLAVRSHDEIGALARSFNAMARQLGELEETKEQFFANVAHELRSPLTAISSGTDLLREGVLPPLSDKQARVVDIVAEAAKRLLGLVNQILEVSRIRAGILPQIDPQPVDLARLMDRAVAELSPEAQRKGVQLDAERVGRNFVYRGDEERLHQVVVNLGANAIHFTPRGGQVGVRLIDSGPELELRVEDTGSGIPRDALPHIFDAYRQAHHRRGGTGLGLAIVHGVVKAHGGRVTVESEEGKGSRFTVLLPRAEVGS